VLRSLGQRPTDRGRGLKMLGSRFVVAAWILLGVGIVGAAISVINRRPVVTPAWAAENCVQSCGTNSGK